MAPLIKINDQPAVSLLLVKPSADSANATPSGDGDMSRAQVMQMIYQLMLLIGTNMSIIQTTYAQSQIAQDQIAENQANESQLQVTKFMEAQQKLEKKEKEAKDWETFGKVMKWVGVAVGLLLGGLLCETPLGFIMVAAVIAFTASPLFNKTVDALGGALGKAMGNKTAGNILAQVIVLVVVTVASCGAEGLSTGLTKLASTAGDDAAEAATQAAAQAAKQVSQKVSEEISEEAASQSSKTAEQLASKATAKDFTPRWTYSSATVFTQTFMSTNFLQESLEAIPGAKNHAWSEVLISLLATAVQIAAAAASYKAASVVSASGNISELLQKLVANPRLFKAGIGSFVAMTQVASDSAQAGQGFNQYEQGLIQKELAPLQAHIQAGEGIFQIWTQLTNLAQQTYKSLMNANEIIFNTNFAADWQACVAAQQYQA